MELPNLTPFERITVHIAIYLGWLVVLVGVGFTAAFAADLVFDLGWGYSRQDIFFAAFVTLAAFAGTRFVPAILKYIDQSRAPRE